jgi:hypothetical protein
LSSPSSVLTHGLGSWSDENLLLTFGFGAGVAVDPEPTPTPDPEETTQTTVGGGSSRRYYTSDSKGELQRFVKNRVKTKEAKLKRVKKTKVRTEPIKSEVKPPVIDKSALEAQQLSDKGVIDAVYAQNVDKDRMANIALMASLLAEHAEEQEEIELLLLMHDL